MVNESYIPTELPYLRILFVFGYLFKQLNLFNSRFCLCCDLAEGKAAFLSGVFTVRWELTKIMAVIVRTAVSLM